MESLAMALKIVKYFTNPPVAATSKRKLNYAGFHFILIYIIWSLDMAHKEEIKTEAQLLDFCTHMCNELIRGVVYGDEIENENLLKYRDSTLNLDGRHPWASRLINCLELHYQCAGRWRKLFDDTKQLEKDAVDELHKIQRRALSTQEANSVDDLSEWRDIIESIMKLHKDTAEKIQNLYREALEVPNLRKRLSEVENPVRVVPIYSIKNKDLVLKKGEDLQLLDNSDNVIWKVRKLDNGKIYTAPSILLIMPGPDDKAEEEVQELHTKINDALLRTTKVASESLVSLLTVYLSRFKSERVHLLQGCDRDLKDSFESTLSSLEALACEHLTDVDGYANLVSCFGVLMSELDSSGDTCDEDTSRQTQEDFSILSQIANQYQSLMDDLQSTNNNLDVDSEEGLQVLKMNIGPKSEEGSRIRRFWEVTYITKEIKRVEEITYIPETPITPRTAGLVEYSEFSFGDESETAESEQITKQSGEERRKFIIEGVIDPRNGEMIAMRDAVSLGILDQANGEYVDICTRARCPIPEAMNDGRIVVTFQTAVKKEDPSKSLGLVTIKHKQAKKSKTYHIRNVVHPVSGKMLTKEDAMEQNILDEACSVYKNPKSGNELLVSEAVKRKLVFADVEGGDEAEEDEPAEVTSKTFVISGVVNRRLKKRVSFKEATMTGLIDRLSGAYNDNVTGEKIYVGDAIKRGFLKAKEVDNAKTLDIDPENRVVIEKVENIRKKLLRPIKVIRAFRAMRMAGLLNPKNDIKENDEELESNHVGE